MISVKTITSLNALAQIRRERLEQADEQRAGRGERIAHEAADDRADEALEAHEEARIVVDRRERSDQHAGRTRKAAPRARTSASPRDWARCRTSRAPTRFNAVARSALPYSVRPKNDVERHDQRDARAARRAGSAR